MSDAERVYQLAALERVKGACAAAQAAVTVAFVLSQEREQAERRRRGRSGAGQGSGEDWGEARGSSGVAESVRREHLGRGIAGQVALARRESPVRGSQHVKLALALVHELPNTYAALASGWLTESRAEIIVRESAHLSGEARTAFDTDLLVMSRYDDVNGADTDTDAEASDYDLGAESVGDVGASALGSLGDRELTRRVRALAYRADPAAAQERYEKAARARRVELRRGVDAMCRLTAHLPLAQAIAAHAALTAAADAARALGDSRVKGQVMADTLVERVTGQATADAVPVEVALVITDESLFQRGEVPAQVPGYGTVPAAWARTLLHPDPEPDPCHCPDLTPDRPAFWRGRADTGGGRGAETADVFGGPTQYVDEFGCFSATAPAHLLHPLDARPRSQHGRCAPPIDRTAGALLPGTQQRTRRDGLQPAPGPDGVAAHGLADEYQAQTIADRARVWLRRLYTHPATGQLVAMDSTRRVFDGNLRRFLIARDAGTCRTPWCDAPIRHLDHITDHAAGGPTTATNGQGLCARCNHTKNHPDWHGRTVGQRGSQPHTTETTTPTGHSYRSSAPPLIPGLKPRPPLVAADDPDHDHHLDYLHDLDDLSRPSDPYEIQAGTGLEETDTAADLEETDAAADLSTVCAAEPLSAFERHLTERLRTEVPRAG